MFERWIAGWLEETTRAYINNLPREKLRVDFRRGHLELENLELRAGPIRDGAFAIRTGLIRRVVLDIPWAALSKEPVKVSVDGVYVLVCPGAEYRDHLAPLQEQSVGGTAGASATSFISPGGAGSGDANGSGLGTAPAPPPTPGGSQASGQQQPPRRLLQWASSSTEVSVTSICVRFESVLGGGVGYGGSPYGFALVIAELSYGVDEERTRATRERAAQEKARPPQSRYTRAVLRGVHLQHLTGSDLTESAASHSARVAAAAGGAGAGDDRAHSASGGRGSASRATAAGSLSARTPPAHQPPCPPRGLRPVGRGMVLWHSSRPRLPRPRRSACRRCRRSWRRGSTSGPCSRPPWCALLT